MTSLLICGMVAAVIGLVVACHPPNLPSGAKWVSDKGCSNGEVYQTLIAPRQRCHCWGHCGYVCEPSSGGGGGGDGGVKSKTTTKKPNSPCAFGGVWYNNKGQKCRCQSFNNKPFYVCEATTTTTASSSSTSSTSTTTNTSSTGSGGEESTTTSSDAGSTTTVGSSTTTETTTTTAASGSN